MKKTIIQQTSIDSFSHDGRGIARINGKTTFIDGALAGETVNFVYTRRKKDYDEGKVVTIESASEFRVSPACPHYDICGACSLQHLEGTEQINVKQSLLLNLLEKYAKTIPKEILQPLVADTWHYRNKARLSVRYVANKNSVFVGFRERDNPRLIADLHNCLILKSEVADSIDTLRHLILSFSSPAAIAQVELAAGDDQIVLIFRNLESLNAEDAQKLKSFAEKTQFIIYLQPAGPESIHLFYPPDAPSFLSYSLPEFDVTFKFKPTDFTQVNSKINRQMVSRALNLLALDSQDVVLDLFCGLGNFTLPIAKKCANVYGVEGSENMVSRADMNMKANNISNAMFMACDLDKNFIEILPKFKHVNKLLLDPPRSGALEVIKALNKLKLDRIVYVSCNPVTFARDADILINTQGYRLMAVGAMDMFPNTAHVESIALFLRE